MGPMLLFDKSVLQAISLDESVWLEQFFLINITPIFYVEVLADLEKNTSGGKIPEQIVGELAKKTPSMGTFSNIHHHRLVINDLLGNKVEMLRRPFIKGIQPKITSKGEIVFYFEESIEDKMLRRWSKKQFFEIEKDAAREWRQTLSGLTFETMMGIAKNTIPNGVHFSSLEQIKAFIDSFIMSDSNAVIDLALFMLDVPQYLRSVIIKRWERELKPSLKVFAPYAAYVFSVDMFFYLALNSSFIAKERPSNKIDLSYLYYLPFCMIFTSKDKLHKRIAPLFMDKNQIFIFGDELKRGLEEMNNYFSQFKEEIDKVGVMRFASYPPQHLETVIGKIWDTMGLKWRKDAEEKKAKSDSTSLQDKELVKKLKEQEESSKPYVRVGGVSSDEASSTTFKRLVSVQKGKWRILPKGIENIKNTQEK